MSGTYKMTHDEIITDVHLTITKEWNKEDVNEFFMAPWKGESLTKHHMSLGMYIRNNYNLWTIPWEPELKEVMGCLCDCSPFHPDNLSMTIIEEVWKKGALCQQQ